MPFLALKIVFSHQSTSFVLILMFLVQLLLILFLLPINLPLIFMIFGGTVIRFKPSLYWLFLGKPHYRNTNNIDTHQH